MGWNSHKPASNSMTAWNHFTAKAEDTLAQACQTDGPTTFLARTSTCWQLDGTPTHIQLLAGPVASVPGGLLLPTVRRTHPQTRADAHSGKGLHSPACWHAQYANPPASSSSTAVMATTIAHCKGYNLAYQSKWLMAWFRNKATQSGFPSNIACNGGGPHTTCRAQYPGGHTGPGDLNLPDMGRHLLLLLLLGPWVPPPTLRPMVPSCGCPICMPFWSSYQVSQ